VQKRCADLGFSLDGDELVVAYRALMTIADDRKVLTNEDILSVISTIRSDQLETSEPVDPFDTPSTAVPHAMHESGYGHGV
jgi:hypothetical protein